MKNTIAAPVMCRPVPALLLALFVISGCSVLPGEVRYNNNIKYVSPQDGVTSTAGPLDSKTIRYRTSTDGVTSTSGQYEGATAYYIERDGGRMPDSPVMRATNQDGGQYGQTQEPANDLPLVIEVSDVLFDFDKAVIKTPYLPELDRWAEYFNNNPQVTAQIFGHTDSTGPAVYNQGLSERRAQAVINYLIGKGVSADRLTAKGFGESQPVAPNTTKEGRQKNRRVELQL